MQIIELLYQYYFNNTDELFSIYKTIMTAINSWFAANINTLKVANEPLLYLKGHSGIEFFFLKILNNIQKINVYLCNVVSKIVMK